ncbi:MAG TPA: threonine synthase [Treponema sp.]|nr:threonine synthase [Treponema sp.]
MRFISSRNIDSKQTVSFKEAVLNSIPADGGLYVPYEEEDLRRWILYADENTSFASIAGSLTSALINTEFSPIICETIATHAFPYEPEVTQLDDNLFFLNLSNGPTGTFKDYGVSYLTSTLETILQLDGQKSILLDATGGELGACMAQAMRGKKLLKSVLLAPKGAFRGMEESDFVWNGGNLYPIEVDGTEEDCHALVRSIFKDRSLVEKFHLTVANTANIGRLLPQVFFYTYAFSRIKKFVDGDIYYALHCGHYGNLVAGLYGWKLSLPVNGFIMPSSQNLLLDAQGNCIVPDSMVPLMQRPAIDPSDPSNLERLEHIFAANSLLLRNFLFPAPISQQQTEEACRRLFVKYHLYADTQTSEAYMAALQRKDIIQDDGAVVLIARNDPCAENTFLRHCLGETAPVSENRKKAMEKSVIGKPTIARGDVDSLISVLNSLNLLRLF